MAPGLNEYRRTGRVGSDYPGGLPRSVYALVILSLVVGLTGLELYIGYHKGWWPFPDPLPPVPGTWEGTCTTDGTPPETMQVRLCLHDRGTFAMIWIGPGYVLDARVWGSWSLEDGNLTLTSKGLKKKVPTPWLPFVLVSGDRTVAVARFVGVGFDGPAESEGNPTPAPAFPRLAKVHGLTGGCDG